MVNRAPHFPTFAAFIGAALALLSLLLPPQAMAVTTLTAYVDQNPAIMGQSVTLTITADDSLKRDALDLTPLEQNFVVGRSSVSSSTQIINFDMKQQTTWTVLLLPRQPGEFTLPSLAIEGVQTQPITLEVLPADQAAERDTLPLAFIETELDRNEIYPGQPALLTATLHVGADLQRGALTAPSAPGITLSQWGEDESGTEVVRGQRYRTVTRRYVVSAAESGPLTLDPIQFEGDLLVGGGDLINRGRARSMVVASDPIELTVLPQPAAYQGEWLVADMVALSDDLGEQAGPYEVGQPISRTLLLTAMGAVADALPAPKVTAPEGMRLYPDKVKREGGVRQDRLIATLRQSVALVASQPGQFTLPEVRVPWWNAKLKRQEWAVLPSRTVEVIPSSGSAATPPDSPQPTAAQPQHPLSTEAGHWPLLTALMFLLWLVTLVWGWRRGRPKIQPLTEKGPSEVDDSALLRACEKHDGTTVLNLLPIWAEAYLGQPVTLPQLSQRLPALAEPIAQLQRSRFAVAKAPWDGTALAKAIRALPPPRRKPVSDLPPLDPTTTLTEPVSKRP
ncbi:BatD family protein [Ferrimonas gelatinilytica]|uniref:BatD family protein n=1 Tax=Ferrimonas gelatinilytica TaxID=1255257 RepID=A0ABP9S629_9GAMM